MARMFPDTSTSRVIFASRAEEAFYDACKEGLSENWRVYYSCTLSTIDSQAGLKDNEIDFVLYHPAYGVMVVEVKGGRIKHKAETGQFYSINRHGERFEIKDPFQQALVWKSRFLRFLRQRKIRVPLSHIVALPSVREDELVESASIVPGIVIGRERMTQLESALKRIVSDCQPEHFLRFNDVADSLHEVLWGRDFTTRLFLKDYLKSNDLRVKDLEAIQETLVQPIAGSKRLAIEGEAGTGKTMLALLLARHFRNMGERVLLLSSNRLLNDYLKSEVGPGIDVKTFSEFAADFGVSLLKPPADYSGSKEDWSQYEAPERLHNAIQKSSLRYDALLCDEAQDVQPFWWEAIETVLESPEESRFLIFFDRSQGVFGSGSSEQGFVPEEVLPIAPPYFPLVYNYRTTREIATFSRSFRTGSSVMQSHCGRLGYVPELIVYENKQDCRQKLGQLFRKLFRDEGLSTQDVTLLSARHPRKPESVVQPNDVIARYPLRFLSPDHEQTDHGQGKVDISTIAGFKGLETSVAVLLNVSEHRLPIDNPIMASLIYVACTRAKHMLYLVVQKDDPKRKAFEEALKLVKNTGAMVLEGSDANFEFIGTVSYFNPERVGWLSVNDPSFQKSSIMFFPHDVQEAGIEDIKPGMQLRFRPRVEGQATVAADLKHIKVEHLEPAHDESESETKDKNEVKNNRQESCVPTESKAEKETSVKTEPAVLTPQKASLDAETVEKTSTKKKSSKKKKIERRISGSIKSNKNMSLNGKTEKTGKQAKKTDQQQEENPDIPIESEEKPEKKNKNETTGDTVTNLKKTSTGKKRRKNKNHV